MFCIFMQKYQIKLQNSSYFMINRYKYEGDLLIFHYNDDFTLSFFMCQEENKGNSLMIQKNLRDFYSQNRYKWQFFHYKRQFYSHFIIFSISCIYKIKKLLNIESCSCFTLITHIIGNILIFLSFCS